MAGKFFEKLVSGLSKTRNSIVSSLNSIFTGFSEIDDDFYEELEEVLIMADMGIHTTENIIESLKEKVKESEAKQILVIKNQISNSELKMGLLLNKYKEEEATARNLLEEKNALMQKISNIKEDIDNQTDAEGKTKAEIIEVKNNINQLTELINDNTAQLEVLQTENQKLNEENEKYEKDIKELRIKIDELQQKIELNSMLKDIDIGELKMLTQNNAIVNNSINTLISKWDKVHAKLSEIEQKGKQEGIN